jgi:dihydrofolate reductase
MRKLILTEFTTLDGVIEAPGGEPDFKYTGWSADYFDDEYLNYKMNELRGTGALLFGRRTYDEFVQAWPDRTDDIGMSDMMNSLPKYVATNSVKKLTWKNSTIISGDVPAGVRKLKEQEGRPVVIHGSGTLAQSLMQHDLIDEYHLMIHPTALGIGKRLFTSIGERKKFKLIKSHVFANGTVVLEFLLDV